MQIRDSLSQSLMPGLSHAGWLAVADRVEDRTDVPARQRERETSWPGVQVGSAEGEDGPMQTQARRREVKTPMVHMSCRMCCRETPLTRLVAVRSDQNCWTFAGRLSGQSVSAQTRRWRCFLLARHAAQKHIGPPRQEAMKSEPSLALPGSRAAREAEEGAGSWLPPRRAEGCGDSASKRRESSKVCLLEAPDLRPPLARQRQKELSFDRPDFGGRAEARPVIEKPRWST